MTANERIIKKLREPVPRWHHALSFGQDYHKLASRISDLNANGWDIKSRKSRHHRYASGRAQQEYRMGSVV